MKLEFLGDISGGGKFKHVVSDNLIRIYHYKLEDLSKLQEAIQEHILDKEGYLNLDELAFITPLNCRLKLVIDEENSGIRKVTNDTFTCKMNRESYRYMLKQIETLKEANSSGHIWLDDLADVEDVDFLLSPGGGW